MMFRVTQWSRNITYKILSSVSKCGQEENTHPQQIQGCKLINYTTGAGNPFFYFFFFLFSPFLSLSLVFTII